VRLGDRLGAGPTRQRHPGLGRELTSQRLGLGDLHGREPGRSIRVQAGLAGDARVECPRAT
jgi:hypothetical protein